MSRAGLSLALILALGACGSVSPLSLAKAVLPGGGPNVAANVQAGKTNAQTLGTTAITEARVEHLAATKVEQSTGAARVKADQVQSVIVNEAPAWLILLALAFWIMPTPAQMGAAIAAWLARAWNSLRRKGA